VLSSPRKADLAGLAGGVLAGAQCDALCDAAPAGAPASVEVGFVAEVIDVVGTVLADVEAQAGRDGCRKHTRQQIQARLDASRRQVQALVISAQHVAQPRP
jgi:hypothetical protein